MIRHLKTLACDYCETPDLDSSDTESQCYREGIENGWYLVERDLCPTCREVAFDLKLGPAVELNELELGQKFMLIGELILWEQNTGAGPSHSIKWILSRGSILTYFGRAKSGEVRGYRDQDGREMFGLVICDVLAKAKPVTGAWGE